MIKVLVVDDSIFMRKIIGSILKRYEDIEIVAYAKNGLEAIEMNKEFSPDIITMDVEMPKLNGIKALKQIMQEKPTKVIMLSSLTQEGASETIEALNSGAYDFVSKPVGGLYLELRKVENELVEKIRESQKVNVSLLNKFKYNEKQEVKPSLGKFLRTSRSLNSSEKDMVVCIGISTGGPNALHKIIPELPEDINAGILIVQHMPPRFTKSLADRLDVLSKVKVREAKDGDLVEKGLVLIAPGGLHMTVEQRGLDKVVRLSKEPSNYIHKPSVNVLFQSIAEVYKKNSVALIMTGMGDDGAEQIKNIKEKGGITIAQSKETCVVYGMPRVAVEKGGIDFIVDLEKIPDKLLEILKQNS